MVFLWLMSFPSVFALVAVSTDMKGLGALVFLIALPVTWIIASLPIYMRAP